MPFHLLKIETIEHTDKNVTIWEDNDLDNVFHYNGELYLLSATFNTGSSITIPASYYLGLDNRVTPAAGDTLGSLSQEPTQHGYTRQPVSSLNGFDIIVGGDGNYRAISSIVTFSASGGSWGPVRNLFLATSSNNSGYLLSTVPLAVERIVSDGQTLTVRISLGLTNC